MCMVNKKWLYSGLIQADCTFLVNINPIWQPIKIPFSQSSVQINLWKIFYIYHHNQLAKEGGLSSSPFTFILIGADHYFHIRKVSIFQHFPRISDREENENIFIHCYLLTSV